MEIAIIGGGLVGRILALELLKKDHTVSIYEKDSENERSAAGWTAAGMLALFAELESAESIIFEKGKRSIKLWEQITKELGIKEAFSQKGTIITAHPQDYGELDHFIDTLKAKVDEAKEIKYLNQKEILEIEPELDQSQRAFYIPQEGVVDAQKFMESSEYFLKNSSNIKWYANDRVTDIDSFKGVYDLTFDTRGIGAEDSLNDLRGVRGEVLWVQNSELNLSRPTRMMHPRYRLYIVPRGEGLYIIGATEIQSNDKSPISVRSSLELLSALYSLHPSFAEARVIKCDTNIRPAFKDNLPKIIQNKNLITINGLYRHGYLLAPAMVEEALEMIE